MCFEKVKNFIEDNWLDLGFIIFALVIMNLYVLPDLDSVLNIIPIEQNENVSINNLLIDKLVLLNSVMIQSSLTILGFILIALIYLYKEERYRLSKFMYVVLIAFSICIFNVCTRSSSAIIVGGISNYTDVIDKTKEAIRFFYYVLTIAIIIFILTVLALIQQKSNNDEVNNLNKNNSPKKCEYKK
ncbi:MAG: hypothetical protein KO464_01630 [Candidatus Methanofastidiosum sp.]|nr:hypothetical protein [Methanofastidiosum sp.]